MNQNIRKCTICEAHEEGFAPRRNPRLCDEHQDWDDILHVTYCKEIKQQHAGVNPVLFCYKHNPDWPPSKKGGYSDLKDLTYRSRDYYSSSSSSQRGESVCLICARIAEIFERAIAEHEHERESRRENDDGNGNGEAKKDVQFKIAVWRPFVCDLSQTQRAVRDEQTAIEKGMLPWRQKCVLALCLATSNPSSPATGSEPEESQESQESQETWTYKPVVTEFIAHYERWCHELTDVSTWDRRLVDLSQVQRWLDRCTREHSETCGKPWLPDELKLPHGFRLIDVERRCVVYPARPTEYEYAALSHVWAAASGSEDRMKLQLEASNLDELTTEGSLQDERLPEVVADAIHLCRELGKAYLWVDRFCIVQDDVELKKAQIDAMGAVYDGASLCIVALADGPTAGLPGLASRPRPVTAHNWSWDLLAPMSNPVGDARPPWINVAIQESRWNDRGWTFQERLFSKRTVYFDANHVYGGCGSELWVELPPGEDEEEWAKYAGNQPQAVTFRPSDLDDDFLGAYRRFVAEFTPRKLTFADDVLHAFAGVSSVFQTRLPQPILLGHPHASFTESLRWLPRPGFSGKRRDVAALPSWSWASWDGPLNWVSRSWTMAPKVYLGEATEVKATLVDFFFSDGLSEQLKRIEEEHKPLNDYLAEQKRFALGVIKTAATAWWPDTSLEDPKTVELSKLDDLVSQVWNFCHAKATSDVPAQNWPPSTAGTPTTDRLHDLDENATAMAALRNLEEHTNLEWWPPAMAKDAETLQRLSTLSDEACETARRTPNSLVFNTTCAKMVVGRFRMSWYVVPPRRHISGGFMSAGEGTNWKSIGITMAMAPELGAELFPQPRECVVALLGVCSAKRYMQWDKGERGVLPVHHLNELCLFVLVMDEDAEGVCRRAAIGVVFANQWAKLNPQWRTVVLA